MKYLLSIPVLCVALSCSTPGPSAKSDSKVSGLYLVDQIGRYYCSQREWDDVRTRQPAMETDEIYSGTCPYEADNSLLLEEREDSSLQLSMKLHFFNRHECTVEGVAQRQADHWIFTQKAKEEEIPCQFKISKKRDQLAIEVAQPDEGCRKFCGLRGTIDGANFPLSSRAALEP